MAYKNAWKCKACPESNGALGCPAWCEVVETEVSSGNERITKECLFQMLPKMLVEVIKASNRPAAEIGAMREGFLTVVEAGMNRVADRAAQLEHKE